MTPIATECCGLARLRCNHVEMFPTLSKQALLSDCSRRPSLSSSVLRCKQQHRRPATVTSRRKRLTRLRSLAGTDMDDQVDSGTSYEHVMLALLDRNPYLSDGSKQAVAASVSLGRSSTTRVTVAFLDIGTLTEEDRKKRIETVMWHFQQRQFSNFEILEKEAEKASVTVGDVADQVGANIVIMSVEAIHAKLVDANLLAEFVPCPMLLLP